MRSHKAHRLRSAGLCFHAKLSAALALHALYALRSTIPVPQPCEAPGRARRLVDEDSWALGSDLKDLHVFSAQALSWDPCSQSRVPFSHVLRAGAKRATQPTAERCDPRTRWLKSATDTGRQSSSRRLPVNTHSPLISTLAKPLDFVHRPPGNRSTNWQHLPMAHAPICTSSGLSALGAQR